MKKEYGRWGVFLREMEKYKVSPCVSEKEAQSLDSVYIFALENGYTLPEHDRIATEIIRNCKEKGF